jgi:hypothetical protein
VRSETVVWIGDDPVMSIDELAAHCAPSGIPNPIPDPKAELTLRPAWRVRQESNSGAMWFTRR